MAIPEYLIPRLTLQFLRLRALQYGLLVATTYLPDEGPESPAKCLYHIYPIGLSADDGHEYLSDGLFDCEYDALEHALRLGAAACARNEKERGEADANTDRSRTKI